jgi:hypothetical protein
MLFSAAFLHSDRFLWAAKSIEGKIFGTRDFQRVVKHFERYAVSRPQTEFAELSHSIIVYVKTFYSTCSTCSTSTAFFSKPGLMSFNPDDVDERLRQENEELKKKVQELTAKVAEYEMILQFSRSSILGPDQGDAAAGGASEAATNAREGAREAATNVVGGAATNTTTTTSLGVGRKSIPFSRRNPKQHQGRMAYLLKKLETKQELTQDVIADMHSYFVARNIMGAGDEFFRAAVVAYAGPGCDEVITDIDTFLGMIQN